MSVFSVTLRLLSPLHIGDGAELRLGFDFVIIKGNTYRLNEDALLQEKEALLVPKPDGSYPLPGQLLTQADFDNPRFFRYKLLGAPRSSKADARLRSFIKDVHDRPYIPGSSLKGAIRTALAWTGWKEVQPRWDASTLKHSRYWAAKPLEQKLFGPDPNRDLLRALQVSDLFGPQHPGGGLRVVNAQVLTKKGASAPVELEALAGDMAFQGSITLDESLFSPQAEGELHFKNRLHWLQQLPQRLQQHSRARLGKLRAWFDEQGNATKIAEFYRRLEAVQLPDNHALLQIGWGSGWDGKTFGTHLQANPREFDQIVRQYRLSKNPRRSAGAPFPTSRRVAVSPTGGEPQPIAPFGWVVLEVNPL